VKPIRRLAFVTNAEKSGAPDLANELVDLAKANGVRTKQTTRFPLPARFLKGMDACCVIGGDGTLLSVAPQAAEFGIPLIGVNRGSLGFLTTFSGDEAKGALPQILKGHYKVDQRAMLDCSPLPKGPTSALNDVLIKDAVNSRLIRLDVYADGELVCGYTCDGLVVSTPTGSTAYNLSAGGPLIHPSVRVLAMTPICPHTLSNRAIIFRDDVKLTVFNRSAGAKLLISVDGQPSVKLESDSPVTIVRSKLTVPLVQRLSHSHFAVVRTKLRWSGGFADLK
jgi:NAD+ kinase